jgi:sugar diacid utilization regulator
MLRKVLLVEDTAVGYLESPLYYGMPSADQLEFFDLLGNYLAGRLKEELNRPALPDNMLDYFAFDLLEGKVTNPELIAERLGYFHWDLLGKGMAQIISIRWLDREDQGSVKFRQLAETFMQQFRDCRVFVYGLEIKLVCSLSEPVEMDPGFLDRIRDILKGNAVSAGVSRPLDQLRYLADFNLQARKASEIGELVEPEEQLHFFDNLSIYYALELACRDYKPDQFIHYGLVTLHNYDMAHDTNLVESLEVYLKHNQSIGEAAAALFIHRNTMNYRVSKIVELTHLNLKDPKVVEHLLISFSVVRFQEYWGPDYAAGSLDVGH